MLFRASANVGFVTEMDGSNDSRIIDASTVWTYCAQNISIGHDNGHEFQVNLASSVPQSLKLIVIVRVHVNICTIQYNALFISRKCSGKCSVMHPFEKYGL